MTESGSPLRLVTSYPPPAVIPRQQLPEFCSSPQAKVESYTFEAELHRHEVVRLRFENRRLADELESARLLPINDPSLDRINVNHDLWIKQQHELRRMNEYKTRYYVVVFILLLVLVKVLLSFHH